MDSNFGTTNYPSRENILARIPEIEIFRRYLGIHVSENDIFCNPLRNDRTPTCNFYRKSDGRLRMRDQAGYFQGDCIDLVMHINGVGYKKALQIIWYDFNANTVTRAKNLDQIIELQNMHVREKAVFHIKTREWDADNVKYWHNYEIPIESLEKFAVYPVEILWMGQGRYEQNIKYRWDPDDPGYAYYFGDNEWKIYFPLRRNFRFLSNTNKLQGLAQLKDSTHLVITKSLKDIIVLDLFDVPAIAPQSEGIVIEELDDMLMYYDTVYVFFDNDGPGRRATLKYAHEGAYPILLPQELRANYNIKDISDYIKKFKYDKTKELIDDFKRKEGLDH